MLAINGRRPQTPYLFVPDRLRLREPEGPPARSRGRLECASVRHDRRVGVAATFDHYEQLVDAHRDALPHARLRPDALLDRLLRQPAAAEEPAPAGHAGVARRGDLRRHCRRRRARSTKPPGGSGCARAPARSHAGWATLVPGNHHDFITGTALDRVYEDEQVPRLQDAPRAGRSGAHQGDAPKSPPPSAAPRRRNDRGGVQPTRLCTARAGRGRRRHDGLPAGTTLQPSAEGGTPVRGAGAEPRLRDRRPRARVVPDEQRVTRDRSRPTGDGTSSRTQALRATIGRDAGWGLTSLIDKAPRHETIAAGAVANAFCRLQGRRRPVPLRERDAGCSLDRRRAGDRERRRRRWCSSRVRCVPVSWRR